ncbi:MAG: tetratricopeptide repeat protein [Candidatus Shapirobacteria bacterium]|nr:tetratricopeptide repeat protein [Candidatus Shapirobacteria bacterium]
MSQKKLKRLKKQQKIIEKEIYKEEVTLGFVEIVKQNWKFLLLLLIGVVFLYLNSLKGDFVSDDYATIPNNPEIKSFSNGLSGGMGGLINWFLAVTMGVKSPIHFHIFSLLIYLTILVVAFVFLYLLLDKRMAKVGIILFAVLPIHVETVSWIAGRPYLMNCLFVLLSLIVLILFLRTGNKKYFYRLLILIPLTFFAEKTRSAALPLLAVLFWISFENRFKKKIDLGKILMIFGFLFLIVVIFLWPQLLNRITTVNSGVNVSESIFYNPFFQYPTAIAKYLQLLWAPVDLTLYHTMFVIPTWLNWLVFLTYLTLVVYFFFKDKKIFFALAFIFLASAPSMAPVKISWLVAERYVFFGSVGFVMFLAILWQKINQKNKILSLIILIILVGFYSVRVFLRNMDWQTNHNLWVRTCQVSPNSHNAWNNIGDDYDKLAQLETTDEGKLNQYLNAVKGFTQSTMIKPNYADAFHNRANIFFKMGRLDLARDSYLTALSFNPAMYQTYLSLIQIDLNERRYDLAMTDLESLKKVQPNSIQVWYVEAVIDAQMGKIDEAKNILKEILKQYPNYTDAANLLQNLN